MLVVSWAAVGYPAMAVMAVRALGGGGQDAGAGGGLNGAGGDGACGVDERGATSAGGFGVRFDL